MKFKAGTMEDTMEDFDDSMAAAIENAFERVWNERMGSQLPSETQEDRRMMFVAIAQGVIRHLKDNSEDGFDVDVPDGEGTVTIETEGTLYDENMMIPLSEMASQRSCT